MNMVRRLFAASAVVLICALAVAPQRAFAVEPPVNESAAAEVALQRALDQPFNLVLEKVEIAEAFKRIAATAKISLSVDPACYDFLPYGATTRVSADFRNSKLRDAIEQVLITLGLQQTVSGSTVIIRPSAPPHAHRPARPAQRTQAAAGPPLGSERVDAAGHARAPERSAFAAGLDHRHPHRTRSPQHRCLHGRRHYFAAARKGDGGNQQAASHDDFPRP